MPSGDVRRVFVASNVVSSPMRRYSLKDILVL